MAYNTQTGEGFEDIEAIAALAHVVENLILTLIAGGALPSSILETIRQNMKTNANLTEGSRQFIQTMLQGMEWSLVAHQQSKKPVV
jgi:hypothetical protein